MSLAGLGRLGGLGLGLSRQKPDAWPPGVSFVYVRKGQGSGQEGMVGIPAGECSELQKGLLPEGSEGIFSSL